MPATRRRRFRSALLLLAMLAATPASAGGFPPDKDIRTGAAFLSTCGDPFAPEDWGAVCIGYVMGMETAFNVAAWADGRLELCTKGVTYNEARDVLLKYLRANPDSLSEPTSMAFWTAISEAYPCGPEPQSGQPPAPKSNTVYRF